jgi:hypothetical protein
MKKINVYRVVDEVNVEVNPDLYPDDKVALKVALKVAKDLLDLKAQVTGGKHDGLTINPTTSQSIDPETKVVEWQAKRLRHANCEHVAVFPEEL